MKKFENIVLIGAGNIAFNLGNALYRKGFQIVQVYNRSIFSAEELAFKLRCEATNNLNDIRKDADLYIIAVSDSALPLLANELNLDSKLVVHTSGTSSMDVLHPISSNIGVFYPLQTFTKDKLLKFKQIPILLEANSTENEDILLEIAGTISNDVRFHTSEERRIAHLAAVFACNFTNYMYAVAESILEENGMEFNLLYPLIRRTAKKIKRNDPRSIQTGPAVRNDQITIEKHLQLLNNNPEIKELYKILSNSIQEHSLEFNIKKKL